MNGKRIAFLVIVLVVVNCTAFLLLNRPDKVPEVPVSPAEVTVSPSPLLHDVYFVPVTGFRNTALSDLSSFSGNILIAQEYKESVDTLPIWNELSTTLVAAKKEDIAKIADIDSTQVALIPLSELTPRHRIVSVQDKALFDTSDWPLRVQLADISTNEVAPEEVHEVLFGGTVVLSRGVAERIEKYGSISYPWEGIAPVLQRADYAFINFKGSITSGCVYDGYTLQFCGQPRYVKGMADAGVDGVSVSGNHIGDYGQSGMEETIQFLDEYNVAHTGLGKTYASAAMPIQVTLGEGETQTTVGILAYNNVFGTAPCADTSAVWGVTCLQDEQRVTEEIQALKSQVDIVVVYPNWGPEYTHVPHAEAQVAWARVFSNAGADMIVGDQAHWVQTMEFMQETPVFYGLGNLVFDQMWSEETGEGLLVRMFVHNGTIIALEPIATKIYDYAQPRIETGEIRNAILSYLSLPVE